MYKSLLLFRLITQEVDVWTLKFHLHRQNLFLVLNSTEMGNCHSVGEQRSVPTQTLGAIPVFKPLTGQCTGMAPIRLSGSDLHKERLVTWWCVLGEGGGGGVCAIMDRKELHRKKTVKINSNKKVDKGTRLAWSLLITYLTVAGD